MVRSRLLSASFKHKFILGLGFFAVFFTFQGVSALAVPYYQMTLGVDPFLLGLAMKLPLLIITFVSPLVGHISDRCNSQLGRRRPFILFFPWLSCLAFGAIWMVPDIWTAQAQLIYFSVLVSVFYLVSIWWTVPMKCLAFEASTDYDERTNVMGFVSYFFKFGALIYHWLFPLAQLAIFGSLAVGIMFVGWGIGLFAIAMFALIPALLLKENSAKPIHKPEEVTIRLGLFKSISQIFRHKNIKILAAIVCAQVFFGALSSSMDRYVLVYHMFDGDIKTGTIWKGVVSTSYAIFGIVAIAVWTYLSEKIGKIVAFKCICLLTMTGGIAKWFIYNPGQEYWLFLDAALCSSMWVSIGVLVTSMLADMIDKDELENAERREGLFVSVKAWVMKVGGSIGIILAGYMLNKIGFDADLSGEQSDTTINLMRIILASGTTLGAFCCFCLIHYYDLTKERLAEIQQALNLKRHA